MMYSEFNVKENKKRKFFLSNKPMLTKVGVLVLLFVFIQSVRYYSGGKESNNLKPKKSEQNKRSESLTISGSEAIQGDRAAESQPLLEEAKQIVMTLTDRTDQVYHQLREAKKRIASLMASNRDHELSDPKGCASSHELKYWKSNEASGGAVVRIVNWNLWNFQEQWDIRKNAIAQTLRELNVHVVGVQEVRLHEDGSTQLEDLAAQAGYPYHLYHHAGQKGRHEEEGVGLMSKFPIVKSESIVIPLSKKSSDLNPRTALRVTLDIASVISSTEKKERDYFIDVIVTHLSYDSGEQCRQISHLRHYLDNSLETCEEDSNEGPSTSLRGMREPSNQVSDSIDNTQQSTSSSRKGYIPQVLMGDLNIYWDFEWPMDYLTTSDIRSFEAIQEFEMESRLGVRSGGCAPHREPVIHHDDSNDHSKKDRGVLLEGFRDVWLEAAGEKSEGWTFPNLAGASNDPARCDRILLRSSSSNKDGRSKTKPSKSRCLSLVPKRTAVIGCDNIEGEKQMTGHGNRAGAPLRRSDHRSVVAEFTVVT